MSEIIEGPFSTPDLYLEGLPDATNLNQTIAPNTEPGAPPNVRFHFPESLGQEEEIAKREIGSVVSATNKFVSARLEKLVSDRNEMGDEYGASLGSLHLLDSAAMMFYPRFDFGTLRGFMGTNKGGYYYRFLKLDHDLDHGQLVLFADLPPESCQTSLASKDRYFGAVAPILRRVSQRADHRKISIKRLNDRGRHDPEGWGYYAWRVDTV